MLRKSRTRERSIESPVVSVKTKFEAEEKRFFSRVRPARLARKSHAGASLLEKPILIKENKTDCLATYIDLHILDSVNDAT